MAEYRFAVDRSNLEGKQGILKADADGYYNDVLVGVFNVENSGGERYIVDKEVQDLLDMGLDKSQMARWLRAGKLIGEQEHPKLSDFIGKDKDMATAKRMWIQRHAELHVDNVAMNFAGLRTEEMSDKIDGRKVWGVYAKIRPVTNVLKESLSDKNSNTAFSLRSFIRRQQNGVEFLRKCTNIFTFDHVQLNGLPKCEKFCMPGVESESMGVKLTNKLARELCELTSDDDILVGAESGAGIITQVIKENGLWREAPSINASILLGRQLSNR